MRFPLFLLPLLLVLLCVIPGFAQTYAVNGIISSTDNGEPLAGATVSVPALQAGSLTNEKGAYTLQLPAGTHTLQVSYLGYQPISRSIRVSNSGTTINLALQPVSSQLQEVEVETNTLRQKLNDTRMSVEKLSSREAKLLPALFGEIDLIKTLQLKPGVQSGGEGSSGLYVRGGGPDQNLVLLDGAVIYNPSHLFGFFSVFNPDAVKSVELYKGGFPAQFGGRLSSVLDVDMNEGNNESIHTSGGLGLISSRLTVEGPVIKDKATFTISGRRTYVDVFTRQINKWSEGKEDYNPIPDYYFYDLNGKFTYKLGANDQLYLSGYYGRDFFNFDNNGFKFGFNWGNTMAALRWRHKYNPRLYANTTLSATSYQYTIKNEFDVFSLDLTSAIRDYSLKTDYDLFVDGGHSIRFGAMATYHGFTVGKLNTYNGDSLTIGAGSNYKAAEFGVYAADDYQVNARLSLNYGLRLSGFGNSGKVYMGLEPRASAKYNLSETVSLKGSFASMMQYIHLVSNSGASLPTDIWYPSTRYVKPQRSQQVALGVSKLFGNGRFLLTNEVYYKWMHRQIDFRNGANLFLNDSLESEFLFGKGRSYGNEVYLEKTKGKTTGWIGYTLSWTERKFDMEDNTEDINGGNWFPARYDRRHDLNVVVLHKLSKRLSLTGVFVFSTGDAYSMPVARFAFQDVEGEDAAVVPIYLRRNGFRQVSYHRLDLGAVLKLRPKHGEADLTFSVYNAYNRRNPYFVYIEQRKDEGDGRILGFQAKQVSLFPVVPSVTYNFKF
ncbi:TonB-dependent receptor [Pontibacter sp. 172403-2]|uniref:TonB-dependent receptor n=1 Tax=Pontibacter rufus TaxID=2791028 RepID=UPI0018AF7EAC|nr:TonB-dependent receptor [Pontibacter sp. 172403-2]MBF9252763.1 TonB-dependent receptor [Pontibacter sp. 172403-2]